MLVMIGASASGKTEIAKRLIEKYGFKKMITYTTRDKRPGEIDGVDYHFLTTEQFKERLAQNFFLETVIYNHHYYGTAFKDTDSNKVLIVDPQGANVLYEKMNGQNLYCYIESSENLRIKRMESRGDHLRDIQRRIEKDRKRFDKQNLTHIDHVIQNQEDASIDALVAHIYQLYMTHIMQKKTG